MKTLEKITQVTVKNILFATDFSAAADKALSYALEIARRDGATVYAVHVIQPDVYPLVPPSAWPTMAKGEEEFRQLKKRRLIDELQGLSHEVIVEKGEVWETLSDVIRSKDIDLVVLGTQGRRGIRKAALGSVAEQVFRQAKCPVLTVGPASSALGHRAAAMSRILFATDFSPESLAAAPYAVSLAEQRRAQLILLHLTDDLNEEHVKLMRRALEDLVPLGHDLRCQADCIVERGDPATKILEVAHSHGADLIVLGLRPPRAAIGTVTHLARSAAYEIVAEATCPVLTIRA